MERSDTILAAYIKDRREKHLEGYRREDLGFLVRQIPAGGKHGGWIYFANISEPQLDDVIKEQVSFFKNKQLTFEWKTYNFDKPACLHQRLRAQGFSQGELEHLMVFNLKGFKTEKPTLPPNIVIKKTKDAKTMQAIKSLQETIWNNDLSDHFSYIAENKALFSCYVALCGEEVIGSGWTEFLDGSEFPELHGGAIAPTWRNKGIYSALINARLQEISNRGYHYVTVDAAPMSLPILSNKGFTSLATSHPFTLQSTYE